MSSKRPLTYRDAGVDIDAGNALVDRIKPLVAKTHRPEVLGGLGGFGGLFQLGDRFQDPVLVSGTDGVGTKLLLAQQHDRLDHLGIDLVAMCVNDILVCGAEPLFFLDYFACGALDVAQATRVIAGIAEGCTQARCALIGGETAEMPDMYGPGEFDLAGFAVGVVERAHMITGEKIQQGSHLVGLASTGPHSNGYSLIRKLLDQHDDINPALLDALLAPTRIYVPTVQAIIADQRFDVEGMAHITGGGLTENIIRVIPEHLGVSIDMSAWPQPEVFEWMMNQGSIEAQEMRRTFNMGIGFVLVLPADQSQALIDCIQTEQQLDAWVIGEVTSAKASERVQYVDGR